MTATVSAPVAAEQRSHGRLYFWAGLASCVLGVALVFAQLNLKRLGVPWYSPALATLGAVLLLVAVAKRFTIPRITALVLVAAFAGLQWYLFTTVLRLAPYEGPAQAGKPFPAFRASLADGGPFTDADLRDGKRRVMVFFRGRW